MKNFVVTASTKGIGWSVAKSLFEKYRIVKFLLAIVMMKLLLRI